jgi:hypothetical protein
MTCYFLLCETWSLILNEEHSRGEKVLRRIFGLREKKQQKMGSAWGRERMRKEHLSDNLKEINNFGDLRIDEMMDNIKTRNAVSNI